MVYFLAEIENGDKLLPLTIALDGIEASAFLVAVQPRESVPPIIPGGQDGIR